MGIPLSHAWLEFAPSELRSEFENLPGFVQSLGAKTQAETPMDFLSAVTNSLSNAHQRGQMEIDLKSQLLIELFNGQFTATGYRIAPSRSQAPVVIDPDKFEYDDPDWSADSLVAQGVTYHRIRARIVGFNLPFDISRLAIDHGVARGAMYGGFTFALSRKKFWPHLRVKHLSRRSQMIDFAAPRRQRDSRGQRNRGDKTPVRRGYFLDVSTLAHALLSRGFTLGELSRFLEVPHPKLDFDEFDGHPLHR